MDVRGTRSSAVGFTELEVPGADLPLLERELEPLQLRVQLRGHVPVEGSAFKVWG